MGHSLGGYIATEVAIENKNIIEKLVLIDSSGMLTQPTPLLMQYLGIAMDPEPTYERIKKIFEQMYANPLMLHPLVVNAFIRTIKEPGAKHAFKTAFDDSTTRPIESERLKEVKDIPCLIIWGKYDNVIPLDHLKKFKEVFNNAAVEIIENAGHAPFVEKTALVYEKLRSFLTHT